MSVKPRVLDWGSPSHSQVSAISEDWETLEVDETAEAYDLEVDETPMVVQTRETYQTLEDWKTDMPCKITVQREDQATLKILAALKTREASKTVSVAEVVHDLVTREAARLNVR